MNTAVFLRDQRRYFENAYQQFRAFGGPCVYFHRECIRAGDADFLSNRHIEMLYATLTAWGMHRMGNANKTKTKLADWDSFRDSLHAQGSALTQLRSANLLEMSQTEYDHSLTSLKSCYVNLKLAASGATIVVNSKALFHLLPHLIPPIDRQHTIRFFTQPPAKWRDSKGKFKPIPLPLNREAQFGLFRSVCLKIKQLADRVEPALLERELRENAVTAPKAIDNAIVNFVRLNSAGSPSDLSEF